MVTVLLILSTVVFLRVLSNHPLSIIHQWSPEYDSKPYPFLCWHHNVFFNVIQQTPNPARIKWFKAIWCLTSDLSLVSHWNSAILVLFNASQTQFLQPSTRHNLPDNYPFSSTLNTLGLFFTKNLNWQILISTFAKSASKKLGVLWCLCPFFSLYQLFALYRGLFRSCMEYGSHVWGVQLTQLY